MDQRYKDLAAKIHMGDSERIARLFEMMADDTNADMMLAMPGQPVDLADKMSLPIEEVEKRLADMFLQGLVFKSKKTDPPTYRMCRDFIQFHDATILWPDAPEEFMDLWKEYMEVEWPDFAKLIEQVMPRPGFRVIPVGVSIKAKQEVLSFENILELIEDSQHLAVTDCTCRLSMKKCDKPVNNCIQVNQGALYAIERGTGRELTKQEAIDICREAEEHGLVHTAFNTSDPGHVICNCCSCCCEGLDLLINYGTRIIDPSRFKALVDAEACSGCGLCHDACHFGAISWADDDESISLVDAEKCLGCGLCMVDCPDDAIAMEEVREKDFIPGAA